VELSLRDIYYKLYGLFDLYSIDAELGKEILSISTLTIPIFLTDIRKAKLLSSLETEISLHLNSVISLLLNAEQGCFDLVIPRPDKVELRLSNLLKHLENRDYELYQNPLALCLGVDNRNKLICLELGTPQASHLLIAGSTGSGKSELAKSIISEIIERDINEMMEFIIYSPKADYDQFSNLKTLRYGTVIEDTKDIEAILDDLYAIMERRARSRIPKTPIIIILDEVNALVALSDKARELIEQIAMRGRSEVCILILIMQSAKKELLKSNLIRENITCRAIFRTHSKRESTTLANVPEIDCSKLDVGQCFLVNSGKWKMVATPLDDISPQWQRSADYNYSEAKLSLIKGGLDPKDNCILDRGDKDLEELKSEVNEKEILLAIPEHLKLYLKSKDDISKTKIVEILNISNNKACELLSQLDDLKLLLPKISPVHPSPINKARLRELEELYPELFGIKNRIPSRSVFET